MVTIGLCMIVKNEEEVLARCLDSVRDVVDEIVVVDTGSDDNTVEIAKRYTDKVYTFPWIDDFSAARNFSFSKTSCQYCMWMDADDIILEEDRKRLKALKETMPEHVDVVMMRYVTAMDSKGNPTFFYYRERWIRNCAYAKWQGAVHEVITPFGATIREDISIIHSKTRPSDPDRNLSIYEKRIRNRKKLTPRDRFYYGRELYYHERWKDAIGQFRTFLKGNKGWIENNIEACKFLSYCYYKVKDEENGLMSLLHSFSYDTPRAETCCDIGKHFFDKNQYHISIFWYELALNCKPKADSGAFVWMDCYGYIPCLQLCVCYYRMGNMEMSKHYNERAGMYKPDSQAYLTNKMMFDDIKKGAE